jgi:general secretion pathway protein K
VIKRWLADRRGFALIAALWLMVAIMAVGLGFGLRARLHHLAAANAVETTRARRVADAGLADCHSRLAQLLDAPGLEGRSAPVTDPWAPALVQPIDTVALATGRAVVSLRDPDARLHLNRASEADLRRLFIALRIDAGLADRLAQRIMDWRDPDDLRRPRGAERSDYLEAGAPIVPANGPFARLGELRDVLGMTPEVYDSIRPYLTLDGTGLVNFVTATRPVLLALPGMGEQAVAVVVARRTTARPIRSVNDLADQLPSGARSALVDSLPVLEPRVTFETRELLAESIGLTDGSPVRVVERGLFVRAGTSVLLVQREAE